MGGGPHGELNSPALPKGGRREAETILKSGVFDPARDREFRFQGKFNRFEVLKEFDSRDPEVVAIGVKGMRYFLIPLPVLGFTILMGGLFSALGRGLASLILSFSRQGFFLIPCLIILPGIWGT